MRIFIALLPDDACRAALMAQQQQLAGILGSGSFTDATNLHLTLHYIGNVEDTTCLSNSLREVQAAPFTLPINRIGWFHKGGGDILWAGPPEGDLQLLHGLHGAVLAAVRRAGLAAPYAAWQPHITLARKARLPANTTGASLTNGFAGCTLAAQEFALMLSHRVNDMLMYEPLERFPIRI